MNDAASIMALLQSQRDDLAAEDHPEFGDAEPLRDRRSGQGALSLVPVPRGIDVERSKGVDWTVAVQLVERAAARIRSYERKFKAIEVDARAFIGRVDAEQKRLNDHIAMLEAELKQAADRALETESELKALKLETWEAKLARRSTEKKLSDAETEIRTSQKYLGQIEDILRSL